MLIRNTFSIYQTWFQMQTPQKKQTPNIIPYRKPELKYLEKPDPRKKRTLDDRLWENQTLNIWKKLIPEKYWPLDV